MKKFAIEYKWALIFSLVSLLWMFFEKSMGWHGENIERHALYTNFFALPALIVYILAIWDKRENYFNGAMSWKQGFLSGGILSVVVAALTPFVQYIAYTYISPNYLENMIAFTTENGAMEMGIAEEYFSLSTQMLESVFFALSAGIVTSAIVAFFLKRNPKGEH